MKVVLFLLCISVFLQINCSNPSLQKATLLQNFESFLKEKLETIEKSKVLEVLSFLAKENSSKNKLEALSPILKEYLQVEKDASSQNQTMFMYIMNKYFQKEALSFGFSNWTCTECQSIVAYFQKFQNSSLVQYLEDFLESACAIFESTNVCQGIFHEYASEFVKNFFKRIFDPIEVCGSLGFCKDTYHVLDFNDYLKEVLADKPNTTVPQPTLKSTLKVLHLADMHIDFEYEEGKNAFCSEPFCCRGENGDPETPDQGAKYWGTIAVCDIPPRTAEQALRYIAENIKPDLILWTGDNISHDVWHQNVSNQTRPTIFLTGLIKKHLGGIPFYPIFGNHECFPADQFDVFQNETDWLKNQTGNVWREFLDDQAFTSLRLNGYYSSYNERFNLRVIVLNTQTCDTVNFFLLRNPTDPNHILKWMREELYIAERNNQTVYIIGHIPPGNSFCLSQWAERYTALVDRFSHVIRGQFFGHTHQDHFESLHSYVDNSLIGTVFIAPSMTTFTQQNPSFRIFEVDADTKLPLNYDQYRLNLSVVNQNITNETLVWDRAYDILSEYNLTDLSWASMDKLSQSILVDKETRKKFIYHFYAGGPIGELSDEDLDKTYTIRTYHCKTQNPVFVNFVDCLGWTYIEDPLDWLFLVLQSLDGNYHNFTQTVSLPHENAQITE